MDKPTTADEGLAQIVLIHGEMIGTAWGQRLVDAITPVVRELNDLRLENERLTAKLDGGSEDKH